MDMQTQSTDWKSQNFDQQDLGQHKTMDAVRSMIPAGRTGAWLLFAVVAGAALYMFAPERRRAAILEKGRHILGRDTGYGASATLTETSIH
jgi:hypothetical protein